MYRFYYVGFSQFIINFTYSIISYDCVVSAVYKVNV